VVHVGETAVAKRSIGNGGWVQGNALDLHEDFELAVLNAAGMGKHSWPTIGPNLNNFRLTDASGTALHNHPRQVSGPGKRPEIERGPLRDILLGSLHLVLMQGVVSWNLSSYPFRRVVLRPFGSAFPEHKNFSL